MRGVFFIFGPMDFVGGEFNGDEARGHFCVEHAG